ncbi:MAG: hypothetical protein ABIL11_16505 [Chloroflexota bacterium]
MEKIQAIDLHLKTVVHSPQTKVLEFFVAVLGGLEHLQDLSCAAHPIEAPQVLIVLVNRVPAGRYILLMGKINQEGGFPITGRRNNQDQLAFE